MQRRYKKIINLSFVQVERPEGTIVDIESRARKLKVLSKLIASNNNNNSNSKKAKGSVKAGWQMLRERRSGAPGKVRVFYERKDPNIRYFVTKLCIVAIYALF